MKKGMVTIILVVAIFACLAVSVGAATRTALVIGNAAYKSAPLKNPVNDARDMATVLKKSGFIVTLKMNATKREMENSVRKFGKTLRNGGVGLFYYAGHGMQLKGQNYLIPVNALIESESDVKYESLDAGRVLGKMEDAGNDMNIVIFDACRNNPFARSFRSSTPGLARMEAPTGSFIAYATAPGKLAADGEGRNGIYTKHLMYNMKKPGLTIERVFKNVRVAVVSETDKKQTPWESSSLTGDFYFKPKHSKEKFKEKIVFPKENQVLDKSRLFVNTVPNGARVRILNIKPKFFQGIELIPGKYYIEASLPEYVTTRQWILMNSEEHKTINIVLNHSQTTPISKGNIKILSEPSGADIFVGNQFKGISPLELSNLDSGTYQVKAKLKGFSAIEKSVRVNSNRKTEFTLYFERMKTKGKLYVITKPAGCTIELPNIQPRYSYGIELNPGQYKVQVSKSGYIKTTKYVQIPSGAGVQVYVELKRPTALSKASSTSFERKETKGKLYVTTKPSSCTIKILNNHYWYSHGIELNPGQYKVQVSKSGYTSKTKPVQITSGEDVNIYVELKQSNALSKISSTARSGDRGMNSEIDQQQEEESNKGDIEDLEPLLDVISIILGVLPWL